MSESDVDVLVIGGSSRLSGGPMMGAGTHYQRAAGIDDDWEALFHDYMTLNHWQVEAAVVQRLVQRAGVGTSARMGRVAMHWTSPGIMDGLMRTQGDVAFAIFDHRTLEEATRLGTARYKQTIPGSSKKQSPHWNLDVIELMLKEGKVHRAHSVGGLATPIGVPADYLKKASFLERIDSAPFYAVAVRTATVAFTACGLRTDRQARVLGRDGRVIPGLFAAGQEAAAHVR